MTALSAAVQRRIFWRTFFLQAGFNPEGLQALGLLYALAPGLEVLYPEAQRRQQAFERHLTPFNTHPYIAATIVGGILHYEEKVARGEVEAEKVQRFKSTLMGPLAAVGDGFYWRSLRPATGALGVLLVPFIGAWAVLVFLTLYNLVHLWTRWRLFRLGLLYGEGLVTRLAEAKAPLWGQRLRKLSAFCAGAVAGVLSVQAGTQTSLQQAALLALGCLGLGLLAFLLVERRVSPLAIVYAGALLALVVGTLV